MACACLPAPLVSVVTTLIDGPVIACGHPAADLGIEFSAEQHGQCGDVEEQKNRDRALPVRHTPPYGGR